MKTLDDYIDPRQRTPNLLRETSNEIGDIILSLINDQFDNLNGHINRLQAIEKDLNNESEKLETQNWEEDMKMINL